VLVLYQGSIVVTNVHVLRCYQRKEHKYCIQCLGCGGSLHVAFGACKTYGKFETPSQSKKNQPLSPLVTWPAFPTVLTHLIRVEELVDDDSVTLGGAPLGVLAPPKQSRRVSDLADESGYDLMFGNSSDIVVGSYTGFPDEV
jgi:hypothetical protein